MNVLSLFDGMACCRIALERAGIEVEKYYASEIDKHAIKVAQANWPDNIQLGDVAKWQEWDIDWSSIDLVTGGFPCQAWSMAGKQLGDKDERGMLFWTMLDVMKKVLEHNPKAHFLIENVKMKREFEEYITHHTEQALGEVHKILINSALVSAQNRQRYYWTSFPCTQPDDKFIYFGQIKEHQAPLCHYYSEKGLQWIKRHSERTGKRLRIWLDEDKCQMLEASMFKGYSGQRFFAIEDALGYRYQSLLECERAQTVPENYTAHVSNTQRYKMLGNGWTVDVIVHLLKCMTSFSN